MTEQEHTAYWRGYNDAKEAIQSGQLRVWVGLTDEEREEIALEVPMDAVLITEAKLKEKNA